MAIAPALQGAGESGGHLWATSGRVPLRRLGEEGAEDPAQGPPQGGSFPMELLAWAGFSLGFSAVLPWWAFTFCWASQPGSCSAALVEGVDGAGGDTGRQSRPPSRFFQFPDARSQ